MRARVEVTVETVRTDKTRVERMLNENPRFRLYIDTFEDIPTSGVETAPLVQQESRKD